MTPFSVVLGELRRSRGLRQTQLGLSIGVEPCYISSMENGHKGPASTPVLNKIVYALSLSDVEAASLLASAEISKPLRRIPRQANVREYELVHALWQRLGTLSDEQVQLMLLALKMTEKPTEKEGISK